MKRMRHAASLCVARSCLLARYVSVAPAATEAWETLVQLVEGVYPGCELIPLSPRLQREAKQVDELHGSRGPFTCTSPQSTVRAQRKAKLDVSHEKTQSILFGVGAPLQKRPTTSLGERRAHSGGISHAQIPTGVASLLGTVQSHVDTVNLHSEERAQAKSSGFSNAADTPMNVMECAVDSCPLWCALCRMWPPSGPSVPTTAPLLDEEGNALHSFHSVSHCVVLIGGYEESDLRRVVAPALFERLLPLPQNSGDERLISPHSARRLPRYAKEALYAGNKHWFPTKGCAVHGDVLQVVLPLPHSRSVPSCEKSSRTTLFVSVANPNWSIATLNRASHPHDRRAQRARFGFSVHIMKAYTPSILLDVVEMLRAWESNALCVAPVGNEDEESKQEEVSADSEETGVASQTFWLSCVAHTVLALDAHCALNAVDTDGDGMVRHSRAARYATFAISDADRHLVNAVMRTSLSTAESAEVILPDAKSTIFHAVLNLMRTCPEDLMRNAFFFSENFCAERGAARLMAAALNP